MPWNHFRPTPEQIAEECRKIRAEWDEETHRSRWAWPVPEYWTPPVVAVFTAKHRELRGSRQEECPLSDLSG